MIGAGTQSIQNAAHRADVKWIKTKGNRFEIEGQKYISEYVNPFTGEAIRKHFGTGLRDGAWFIFEADGKRQDDEGHHSLTWAKWHYNYVKEQAA